MLRTLSFSK